MRLVPRTRRAWSNILGALALGAMLAAQFGNFDLAASDGLLVASLFLLNVELLVAPMAGRIRIGFVGAALTAMFLFAAFRLYQHDGVALTVLAALGAGSTVAAAVARLWVETRRLVAVGQGAQL